MEDHQHHFMFFIIIIYSLKDKIRMKFSRFLLILIVNFSLLSLVHSTEQNANNEAELLSAFETIKEKCRFLIHKEYANPPSANDLDQLEKTLGSTLPQALKLYHLKLGNLIFGNIDTLPTAHNENNDGTYNSSLLAFIEDGKTQGISAEWIPFCEINGAFVCIEKHDLSEGAHKIGYFSNSHRGLKIEPNIYPNFLQWLVNTFKIN